MRYAVIIAVLICVAGSASAQAPGVSKKQVGDTANAVRSVIRDTAKIVKVDAATFADSAATAGSISLESPNIYGDLNVWGNVRITNQMSWIDTSAMSCARADTFLYIAIPDTFKGSWDADSISSMHPGVVAIPGGWNGWTYWGSFTKGQDTQEDPYIRVSNDAIHWYRFGWDTGATDSLVDPMWTEDTVGCEGGYLSDPDLFMGGNGKMYMAFRANIDDSETVFITGSADGRVWSEPVRVVPWANRFSLENVYLSPSFWTDTNMSVGMWCVHQPTNDNETYWNKFRIEYWTSPHPESMMTKIGIVTGWGPTEPYYDSTAQYTMGKDTFPTGIYGSIDHLPDSSLPLWRPWHIDVIANGGGNKAVLISAQGGANDIYALYLGQTDNGRRLQICHTPILDTLLGTAWDASVYRATGWWEDQNGQRVMRIMYSGMDTVFIGGSTEATSRLATGLTTLYFGSTSTFGANSVDSSHIKDGSISNADLLDGCVDSNAIATNSVIGTKIKTDAVTATKIAAGAVGTSEIENGSVANADMSSTAVDSNVTVANGLSMSDMDWRPQYLTDWVVAQSQYADNDSIGLYWNVTQGTGMAQRDYLFLDSTWQGSDAAIVTCFLDIQESYDADSVGIWLLTDGSVDSIQAYSDSAGHAGQPLCDSLYTTYTTAFTTTSLTRIAFVLNKNFVKGDRIRLLFYDALAGNNDRTKVARIELVGQKL